MCCLETIFILLFLSILLVGLAQRLHIPYPITLILGGIAIGFIPGLQPIEFEPHLILSIVLPPILYYAAFGISYREFKYNWKNIFSLALGLVLVTTVIVALFFKWIFPEYPWALAFAFGAIVSPPDAVSATAIFKRFSISSHLETTLEGESLVNDASALVLYKIAVLALLSGSFSTMDAESEFIRSVTGGIGLGIILGFLLQMFSRNMLEPVLGVVFSFTIPYVTFLIADYFGVSGVLAVVVCGLIGAQILLTHHSSLRRVLGYATWDIFIILLNCFVFVLIGLQLREIAKTFTIRQMVLYSAYGFLVTVVMVIVRMAWVYGIAYLRKDPNLKPKEAALVGWSGMRGIVSLAAAIGLPLATYDGMPLNGRNEVIFITFVVILLTLLIPGLSLPSLIRWLKLQLHAHHTETGKIRGELAKVADLRLHHLHNSLSINRTEYDFLRSYFHTQHRMQEISHAAEYRLPNVEQARIKVIQSQRKKLFELWEQSEIDDRLFTRLENELDMIEVTKARAELK